MPEPEFEVVVHERQDAAEGVVAIDLVAPSGAELPGWTPGSHLDVMLTDDLVRQYSLCGDPADRHRYRIGVLREPESRGGSAFVHDKLHPGATVRVRGPRNNFELVDADRYVFVAGGIGITPILPMIRAVAAAGADWSLVYGGRTESSMAFVDALRATDPDRVHLRPQEQHGLLDLGATLAGRDAGTAVYCCGPAPLIDAVQEHVAADPGGSLHVERFVNALVSGPDEDSSFEVELASSGTSLTVPADRSILDVAEEAGVDVDWSCREGVCGSCQTAVISGDIDHRDAVLSDDERESGDVMQICVSRAAGPKLVLDL
ncbi:PDR/VanB family oxidoreductase [Pseudonocardia alni]|uniref:PDR/VanB family oxidoreductase n=1 Tax=Pseudonocardia alni TaxID=33907 RepID=UPI0033C2022E